jgi:hypothetical protein
VLHAVADGLDDARSLVPEEDGQRMTEPRLDHVQVGVADACRLDADERLARPGLVELELGHAEPAKLRQDDAAIRRGSTTRG